MKMLVLRIFKNFAAQAAGAILLLASASHACVPHDCTGSAAAAYYSAQVKLEAAFRDYIKALDAEKERAGKIKELMMKANEKTEEALKIEGVRYNLLQRIAHEQSRYYELLKVEAELDTRIAEAKHRRTSR